MTRRAFLLTPLAAEPKPKPRPRSTEDRLSALESAMAIVWLQLNLDKDEREHPDYPGWYDGRAAWLEEKLSRVRGGKQ